mgnify:CR=1 FL=1
MRTQTNFAREMRAGEEEQIDQLLRMSFASPTEAQQVRKLRKSRVYAGETVLPLGDEIIGYYALSYLIKPKGWLCLAPVAVHPEHQRQGRGKRMIGMLTEWARLTQSPIVVLGDPAFYEKAGFDGAMAAHLHTPYEIKKTMLAGVSTPAKQQELVYPPAFSGV